MVQNMNKNDIKDCIEEAAQYRKEELSRINNVNTKYDDATTKAILFFKINKDILLYNHKEEDYDHMRQKIVTILKYKYPGSDVKVLYKMLTRNLITPISYWIFIYGFIAWISLNLLKFVSDSWFIALWQGALCGCAGFIISIILHCELKFKWLYIKTPKGP